MSYAQITQGFAEAALLHQAMGVLSWDAAVIMPQAAAAQRGAQIAQIEALVFERYAALHALYQDQGMDDCPPDRWNQANRREILRVLHETLAVPKDLQYHLTKAKTACEVVWRQARAEDNFALVVEELKTVVRLTREALQAKAEAYQQRGEELNLLDVAIAHHEPGLRSVKAETLLEEHALFLQDFLPQALEVSAKRLANNPHAPTLDTALQQRVSRALCYRIGLPAEASRIDVSTHPFSSTYPHDSRITLRFSTEEPLQGIMAALHETGHSLYDLQLPQEWNDQPVGQARGMTLHESQSLSMEKHVGLHPHYLRWLSQYLATEHHNAVAPEQLKAHAWKVVRSPIRVSADEVTYPLHVLLRFRLEKALLLDHMPVSALSGAFRDGLAALVGVKIDHDRDGCLQDIHWYLGEFGYFPCYALGAMAAAQLCRTAFAAEATIAEELARGRVDCLQRWLRTYVHQHASVATTDEILQQATGQVLSAQALQEHIQQRYGV